MLEEKPHPGSRGNIGTHDDERVVGVLKHGAGEVIGEQVKQDIVGLDKALEHVHSDKEEIEG
jgi:hypothetical protein